MLSDDLFVALDLHDKSNPNMVCYTRLGHWLLRWYKIIGVVYYLLTWQTGKVTLLRRHDIKASIISIGTEETI